MGKAGPKYALRPLSLYFCMLVRFLYENVQSLPLDAVCVVEILCWNKLFVYSGLEMYRVIVVDFGSE